MRACAPARIFCVIARVKCYDGANKNGVAMSSEAELLDTQFVARVSAGDLPRTTTHSDADPALLRRIFESQLLSRLLDFQSRNLQKQGGSFYTIGSAGHEGNAAIAAALTVGDPALLHYRDAAFYIQRSAQLDGQNALRDLLLSFTASASDPISAGRHKVLGSVALNIPPQTSTIASHLPKAVGLATSIALHKRCGTVGNLAPDALVMCSFGDASFNHSTAQGAINTAGWMAYQKMHLPLLFVCEDNGIGISTPTPDGWIENAMQRHPSIRYFRCNGLDILDTYNTAREAAAYIRKTRKPAFLHMECVRLMGHAGSDVQSTYRAQADIDHTYANDPLLYSAGILLEHGIMSAEEIIALHTKTWKAIEEASARAIAEPKLDSADAVMESIVPPKRKATLKPLSNSNKAAPLTLNKMLGATLDDLMQQHPSIVMAGEDIGRKGGVYGVTNKLQATHGAHRVIDTLLDEQTILGLAIGLGQNGFTPIPEIQFLAYLHNAEDQLRGEAATLSFFSNGQLTNPMVIRIAGLAYQKGFGGHFHNDNSFAVLRDIPGIVMACPSNPLDGARMLHEAVRLAHEAQRVVVFLEPIALYNTKDLHAEGDGLWAASLSDATSAKPLALGEVGVHGNGTGLAILTYGNGYYLSRQAEAELTDVKLRIVDIRWLMPLPAEAILEAIAPCERVLIVDECRETGSLSEQLMALLCEHAPNKKAARLCARDSFIPIGKASTLTLPSKESIVEAVRKLMN